MDISFEFGLILVLSGIVVGFINTLAAGASALSVAVFMLLGLPVTAANGTNRLPVIFQNLTASLNFFRQSRLDLRLGIRFSVPMIIGTVIGAQVATDVSDMLFKICLGVVLTGILIVMLFLPLDSLRGGREKSDVSITDYVCFGLIGFYGGYIYIGLGYLLLGVMFARFRFDIIKANALKNFVILATSPFAFLVFVLNDQVNYGFGLLHAAGNIAGAWVASHYASIFGVRFLKWFIIAVIIFVAGDMFGIISLKKILGGFI